jgi:hypothetical protein
MVTPTDGFSVTRLKGDLPRSELLWEGQPTAVRVDGVTLEYQLQLPAGHLLFLTEDSPFEEGLHIYLLNRDKRIVDGLELAGPYASGILRDVMSEPDGTVSFSFFGDDRWRVAVNDTPLGFLAARVSAPAKRKSGLRGTPVLTIRRVG